MSGPAVSSVESLGIDPVELPHPPAEIALRGLDEQMIVIIHQAVGMAKPVEPGNNGNEDVKKEQPILVVPKDGTAGIPTGGDMVYCTGIFYAQRARHECYLSQQH
jgi:hypothetical protein